MAHRWPAIVSPAGAGGRRPGTAADVTSTDRPRPSARSASWSAEPAGVAFGSPRRRCRASRREPAAAPTGPPGVPTCRSWPTPLSTVRPARRRRGWRAWVAGARPRTLPAAVVPVLVGTACAAGRTDVVAWRALAAGRGGTRPAGRARTTPTTTATACGAPTATTRRVGPVRLVGSGLRSPGAVKRAALLSFLVAGVAGLALAVAVGPELVVVGAAAIAAGLVLHRRLAPLRLPRAGRAVRVRVLRRGGHRRLGLRAGGVAVVAGAGASVPVGLLATALLVVNNLRDIPGDTASGKRTLAVRLGDGPHPLAVRRPAGGQRR